MTGLASITFRPLSPEEIINLTKQAGLDGIEWGGDVHVPDVQTAKRVRRQTEEAGLSVLSYGSYFRVGQSPLCQWKEAVAIAKALSAPVIRVWAYHKPSREVTREEYQRIIKEAKEMVRLADGITICFECHPNTLTDHYASSLSLIKDVGNVKMYWQPNQNYDDAYNLLALKELLPYLINVHVFHWDMLNRYPLKEGAEIWSRYIRLIQTSGQNCSFLLEFLYDDNPASLSEEAAVLKKLLMGGQS